MYVYQYGKDKGLSALELCVVPLTVIEQKFSSMIYYMHIVWIVHFEAVKLRKEDWGNDIPSCGKMDAWRKTG